MTRRHAGGFSLLELMVVVTIVAILVGLAVPNYRTWVLNTRIRGAAESIQNGLRTARNEAAQRGKNVRFELTSTDATWQVCELPVGKTACVDGTVIDQHGVADSAGIVITASKATADLTTYAALTGGLPGGITFGPLARPLVPDYGTTALLRIDASFPSNTDTRWLATTISAGGSVQMCDVRLPKTTAPNGCK
ncbi:MAG TPA: GspH/FimT family pseudopilin [Luteibacter sp.]|uniref:GspH/FimT family pseudopilin n=1 Tax=Luteibacter sp. TaxID=1886636 RepID=UPI002B6FA02F|nr:GspH/FimT family pseudopilin [Luteibacter sp.]HVI55285.1 GspH/FimT family pseudopilin [Luteibacter sp.]